MNIAKKLQRPILNFRKPLIGRLSLILPSHWSKYRQQVQHGRGQPREARGVTETTWAASAINNSKAIQHPWLNAGGGFPAPL